MFLIKRVATGGIFPEYKYNIHYRFPSLKQSHIKQLPSKIMVNIKRNQCNKNCQTYFKVFQLDNMLMIQFLE